MSFTCHAYGICVTNRATRARYSSDFASDFALRLLVVAYCACETSFLPF